MNEGTDTVESQNVTKNKDSFDPLLQSTILNKDKENRRAAFNTAWLERWNTGYYGTYNPGYFSVEDNESPFSDYSSRGWKIHISFEKGKERDVAETLFVNGLYFKVESEIGTYFNGTKESGATIYIGSNANMSAIAEFIEQNFGSILTEGRVATYKVGDETHKVLIGSGTDIELKPRIAARFDIAKSEYGWYPSGNKKYADSMIPSWLNNLTGADGLPILREDEERVVNAVNTWKIRTPYQRTLDIEHILKPAVKRAKIELAKDFGEGFVFGKST